MKNFFRARIAPFFGIVVLVVAVGFSIAGCKTEDDLNDNDYKMLNGVWDRGDIVVTFNKDSAVFTQINPDSGWETVLKRGHIKIDDKKFRNIIKSGNLKWTAQQLTFDTTTFVVKDWSDCTITMAADGQTFQVYDPDTINTNSIYTKK